MPGSLGRKEPRASHGASSKEKALFGWKLSGFQVLIAIHPRSSERAILAFSRKSAPCPSPEPSLGVEMPISSNIRFYFWEVLGLWTWTDSIGGRSLVVPEM